MVLDRWEEVLTGLETDFQSQASVIDWVAKYRLIEGYRQRHNLSWDSPRLKGLDLQYHDLRPGKCLASRVGLEKLVSDEDTLQAVDHPRETPAPTSGGDVCRNSVSTLWLPTGIRSCLMWERNTLSV